MAGDSTTRLDAVRVGSHYVSLMMTGPFDSNGQETNFNKVLKENGGCLQQKPRGSVNNVQKVLPQAHSVVDSFNTPVRDGPTVFRVMPNSIRVDLMTSVEHKARDNGKLVNACMFIVAHGRSQCVFRLALDRSGEHELILYAPAKKTWRLAKLPIGTPESPSAFIRMVPTELVADAAAALTRFLKAIMNLDVFTTFLNANGWVLTRAVQDAAGFTRPLSYIVREREFYRFADSHSASHPGVTWNQLVGMFAEQRGLDVSDIFGRDDAEADKADDDAEADKADEADDDAEAENEFEVTGTAASPNSSINTSAYSEFEPPSPDTTLNTSFDSDCGPGESPTRPKLKRSQAFSARDVIDLTQEMDDATLEQTTVKLEPKTEDASVASVSSEEEDLDATEPDIKIEPAQEQL